MHPYREFVRAACLFGWVFENWIVAFMVDVCVYVIQGLQHEGFVKGSALVCYIWKERNV